MNRCQRCGVPYHPDLLRCPLCNSLSHQEGVRRRKLWFLTNTLAVSFVALVVLGRVLTGPDIAIGMTSADCAQTQILKQQTRDQLMQLEGSPDSAKEQLAELSENWSSLANNYVPGKYSWSTSGAEHRWLEKIALVTSGIAQDQTIELEAPHESMESYALQLLRVEYRFCGN